MIGYYALALAVVAVLVAIPWAVPRLIVWLAERPTRLPRATTGGTFDWRRFGLVVYALALVALVDYAGFFATALLLLALAPISVLAFVLLVVHAGRNVDRWDVRDGDGPRWPWNWRPR